MKDGLQFENSQNKKKKEGSNSYICLKLLAYTGILCQRAIQKCAALQSGDLYLQIMDYPQRRTKFVTYLGGKTDMTVFIFCMYVLNADKKI